MRHTPLSCVRSSSHAPADTFSRFPPLTHTTQRRWVPLHPDPRPPLAGPSGPHTPSAHRSSKPSHRLHLGLPLSHLCSVTNTPFQSRPPLRTHPLNMPVPHLQAEVIGVSRLPMLGASGPPGSQQEWRRQGQAPRPEAGPVLAEPGRPPTGVGPGCPSAAWMRPHSPRCPHAPVTMGQCWRDGHVGSWPQALPCCLPRPRTGPLLQGLRPQPLPLHILPCLRGLFPFHSPSTFPLPPPLASVERAEVGGEGSSGPSM